MELEQMLASLEHAGRDERRRQELGAMIDRMGAAERAERKRGFWWWSVRVAAAACVFFFISTAVRIWFIPTEKAVQVAQTEVPVVPEVRSVAPAPVEEPEVTVAPAPRIKRTLSVQPVVEMPEQQPVEELLAEEVALPEVEEPLDTAEVPTVVIEDDIAPDTELVAEAAVEQQPVVALPQDEPPAEPEKSTIGSFFKSLFRLAEPSAMDGTTLDLLEF